jgi:hypothetical protein
MKLYQKSILIFGLALPLVAAGALVGIGSFVKSRMMASYNHKEQLRTVFEQNRIGGLEIEAQVARQIPHLERWNQDMSQETASAVAKHLREIYESLPDKEIQQTAFEKPSGKAGFGAAAAQNASQVRIALRGTYRSLQKAFLDLETRMPQLQLEDMRMDPVASHASLVNFQVTYTAWEN